MREQPGIGPSGLAMGYIDYTGQWVIPPRFRRAGAFSRGIARVQDTEDGPYYYIDHTGQRVADEPVERIQAGLVPVKKDNVWGFADPETGEVVVEAKYARVWDFSEGLAVVMNSADSPPQHPMFWWRWIDYTGRDVIVRRAPWAGGEYWPGVGSFHEGVAAVATQVGGSGAAAAQYKFGFIDHTGKSVIESQFDGAGDFHDGRAEVCIEKKWGFIDHAGKIVLPIEYARLKPFSEGFAAVRLSPEQEKAAGLPRAPGGREDAGWWGYVDRSGKLVIPPQYQQAEAFSDGLAYVENDGFQGFIDYAGNVVFDLTVTDWNKPASSE